MGPGRDRTRDSWNCICSQTRYRLRYVARLKWELTDPFFNVHPDYLQGFMVVLDTCKTEEDPFKNESARVVTKDLPL